jgi:DNA mismatch repair protein MutS2
VAARLSMPRPDTTPGSPGSTGEPAAGREAVDPSELAGPVPVVGDRVSVRHLGLEGRILGIHDGDAEVDVRGKRLRAHIRELTVIGGPPPPATGRVNVSVQLQPREDAASTDLNVIGCTVEEALSRAQRFLDEALLADTRTFRVIHGYGTGQLRRAFTEFLEKHPLVAKFQAAPPEHGGGGVTVVELKD